MKRGLLAIATAVSVVGWLACSASTERNNDDDATTSQGGSGGSASGGSDVGGFNFGGMTPGGLTCSSDLRYVLDAQGVVVEECWPDGGCSGGACVEPCRAAGDSQGNVGCDFRVATPHFYTGIQPPCFAAFVANNWPKDAQITVTYNNQSYDVTQFGRIPVAGQAETAWPAVPATGVPPGEVAVLFLSQDPSSVNGNSLTCPIPPAIDQAEGTAIPSPDPGSGVNTAWHITSSIPVSAYDIIPYGGADSYLPSAELLLPTTAWGDNYIAVTPRPSSGPPWGQLVAAEDNTTIQILPTVGLPAAGSVPAAPANTPTTFTLNAGEYVQWQLEGGQEMTGTVIQADKPVAFTGGDAYICYSSATSYGGGCDSAHQMIPPIRAMGSEYVGPPFADRGTVAESIPYRIVGAVDGTTLTYDPPIPNAATTLQSGQVIEFETVGAFTVRSQDADHPFYVGQIMPGCNVTGNSGNLGDEEYVNILPPAQFLKKYVFFTDPTYPTTNLVFIRVADANGTFYDVNLDCLGAVSGWQAVGGSGRYEITNVDLIRQGVSNGGCTNGPHVAESEGAFGLMVWGLDWFSSYGYPAGGSVAQINTVTVPPVPQ